MKKKIVLPLLLLVVAFIILFAFQKEKEYEIVSDGYLNTLSSITISSKFNPEEELVYCKSLIEMYDRLFSVNNTESDIYKINNSEEKIKVSQECYDLIKEAAAFYYDTEGKFDITIGTLSDIWTKTFETKILPKIEEIENAKSLCNYSTLKFYDEELSVEKTIKNQKLNLGAIAKGYITDKIVEYLKSRDVGGALINLGGNVFGYGTKADGEKWKVGITDPNKRDEVLMALDIKNECVITSGDYERYADIQNERYHHIIDAKTGYPARTGLKSVSIISDNATEADALSTSCFLVGLEESRKLLEKYAVFAVFVTDDNKVYYSSELREKIQIYSQNYEFFEIN